MSATVSNIVFDDIFTINAIDKEGKKFDRGVAFAFTLLLNITSYNAQFPGSTLTRKTMTWI